jgi:hypothetical protein
MTEIETLTDEDRADLERREGKNLIVIKAEAKALRIIDAQGKRIAALEVRLAEGERLVGESTEKLLRAAKRIAELEAKADAAGHATK